jgi:hypothetical protein
MAMPLICLILVKFSGVWPAPKAWLGEAVKSQTNQTLARQA